MKRNQKKNKRTEQNHRYRAKREKTEQMSLFHSSSSNIDWPYFYDMTVLFLHLLFMDQSKENEIKPSDTDIDTTVSVVAN